MSSYSITTYNSNGDIKTKQKIKVCDNGHQDSYYKESVMENQQEKIIREAGNPNLSGQLNEQLMPNVTDLKYFHKHWKRWNRWFRSLWFAWPFIGLAPWLNALDKSDKLKQEDAQVNAPVNAQPAPEKN